jgi:signal transduction histidine kinase
LFPTCFALPCLLWLLSWSWELPDAHTGLERLFVFTTPSSLGARVMPALAGVNLVVSYRTSHDPDVRRRLRWIMATLVVGFSAYLGLGQLPDAFGSGPLVSYRWLMLALMPVPLSVAAAILRYRLFDIEMILTRSLLAGALTTMVAVAYTLVIVVLPRVDSRPSTFAALLLGSAVAGVAFAARRTLSVRITRLVYGERNDPYAVISRLSEVNTAAETDSVLPDVVSTLASALRLPYVRLDLVTPEGTLEASASFGTPTGASTVLPIEDEQGPLGRLELDVGLGREPFGPADRRLLDDLARQLTGAVRTVFLARALQRSRERLVLAREEERRRLRRDLHDGVGPTLAAQSMQLEVAARLVASNPDAAERLLEQLSSSAQSVIADVRQIVEDLRPAALDQLGLVSAIREFTRRFDGVRADAAEPFWVDVRAEGDLGELPAAVEVAAFRIAIEAVNNAVRYSGGRTCTVCLRRTDSLELTVTDDGLGLQDRVHGTGVGLTSMRERAAELGGACTIGGRADGPGTVVQVRLPVRNLETLT